MAEEIEKILVAAFEALAALDDVPVEDVVEEFIAGFRGAK